MTPLICASLGLVALIAGFQSDQLAWPQVAMAVAGYMFAGTVVFMGKSSDKKET